MKKAIRGLVAVITGGSSGIGLATAQRFVSKEAHMFSSQAAVKANSMQQSGRSAKITTTTTTLPVFRVTSQIWQILIGCMLR
jgi:NADP-dependent 3-hydroxy acid dehydrogenase YdfG